MSKDMAVYRRITITLHPIELEKLDRIAKDNDETKSGMVARLIRNFAED
jgi:metal-responsive CopG/Arc/MetJ family transcriptional regulator